MSDSNPLSKSYQTRRGNKLVTESTATACPKCKAVMGRTEGGFVCVRCSVEYDSDVKRVTPGQNKYHAQRATDGDRTFASELEREVYKTLQILERGGHISNIRFQQKIHVLPSVTHNIDFIVFDIKRGIDVGVEAKGKEDLRWQTLAQMYQDLAPIPIQVWMKDKGRVFMLKEIDVGNYRIVEKGQP